MKTYEKIGWLDHVQDIETGEVIQEGTPVSQVNMNHMDEGIFTNREAVILHEAQIADAQKEETGESWFPLVIYILFEKNSRKCKSTCEWKQVVRIRHDML